VLLLALLGVVATLQYRWVGDVSVAERDRLQASLRSRASEFAAALDGDVTRAFAAFEIDAARFDADAAGAVSEAVDRAARESATGNAVRAVFVAGPGEAETVRRWERDSATLETVTWPPELEPTRRRLATASPLAVAGVPLPPGFMGDALDGEAPALIVPMTPQDTPFHSTPGQAGTDQYMVRTLPPRTAWHALVVWLDPDRVGSEVIGPLVARHFGDSASSDFNVSVVSKGSGRSLFRSDAADVDPKSADLAADVFALRLADLHWTRPVAPPSLPGEGTSTTVKDRVAITIVRRGDAGAGESPVPTGSGAGWRVLVRARGGSLDAVVARSRMRNLAVSLGVLGILAASFALILIGSARAQRLARQQLEFVASVSHELRTPLAVIRSAGENLADGVVAGDQVAQYGALIRNEGRRLSDMVERVMDFSGMTSGAVARSRRPIDVAAVVDATVSAVQPDAAERGVTMHVRTADHRPLVNADADALRSALQNAVGNAVKYSTAGGAVEIDVVATPRTLRLTVSDRGIGIDAGDIPHVFKPFFRGRRAVASQVRGSGVGLSVVQRVVVAHGGDVRIASRDGGGTVLEIELPIVPASGAVSA